ncbi:hypothetical protein I5Q34_31665 [Streptomyces sp. AV19]|uniref:hypothetical protein n=1 Tax=Streptomyces sp. AV19 TaxID=2793068 RepID=UPI0018FE5E05|nr:hypothetical protein [Streptomyces sp. AV19]MBH1938767.1 hypothetical protein [Streptomyces sp. AV19]MDG4533956.1 hypothetical protein [Streptomyces sp. AV19]
MILLPHSSGPTAMPVPVEGCAVCVRLDSAWRAAWKRGDRESAGKFADGFVKHHGRKHPGAW